MADFFDTDEIVKSYDSLIVAKIFRYVKPYRSLLAVTALALVLSTLGELLLPIIAQRTVDDALVLSFSALREPLAGDPRMKGIKIPGDAPRALGFAFMRRKGLSAIPAEKRQALEKEGLLLPGPYYLTPIADPRVLPASLQASLETEYPRMSGEMARPVLADGYFIAPQALVRALSPADAKALRAGDAKVVRANGTLFMISLFLVLAASFAQTWSTSLIGQNVMKAIRMDLFTRTASQSLAFLSRQPVGRLVTRLTSDVETINEFFTNVLVSFIKDVSIMIGVIAVLFGMSPLLALVTLLSLPPVLVATSVSRRMARDAFRKQRTWLSKVNSFIAEHISGVAVVKLFGRERSVAASFDGRNTELMKANLGEMYVMATFRPLIEFFSATSTAVILWYGAGLHDKGLLSLGTLIAFVNLIRMFYSPVQDISEKFTLLQSAMAGGERVFKLLEADERIPDRPTAALPKPLLGRIEFDHVWFAYKEGEWVLKDLSFTVESGQTVAIVGYTGAGKSTIALLLSRLWDIQKGEIRLDGVPIKQLPLAGLRQAIRPVMQDVFLFSGTVAENIELGLKLDRSQVEKAAEAVHADQFIKNLPDAYDAKLGEGASTLSSGQRQLLSFARVVAHDPRIIVLDEATSSVDTETERLVQAGLDELMKGRTTIAIAHRLSTIKHANQILVLSEGRIAERGTHDGLIQKMGIYYNLYRLQWGHGGINPE